MEPDKGPQNARKPVILIFETLQKRFLFTFIFSNPSKQGVVEIHEFMIHAV